ncbi:beta strand repeat-containing protein [Microbacterium maritypicum]
MAASGISRVRRQRRTARDLSVDGIRRRTGWVGMLAVLLVAASTLTATPAMAAETSITLTPGTVTAASGAATTFTVGISCSTDGGCTDAKVTIPTTAVTGTPGVTDVGSWFGTSTCPDLTRSVSAGQVVYSFTSTLPTGSRQCTFPVTPPNYKLADNTVATLTATLTSSNSDTSSAAPVTYTVTASRSASVTNQAQATVIVGQPFTYTMQFLCGSSTGSVGTSAISMTSTLPAGFEYQSHSINRAVTGTVAYDEATRRLTYSDPTGGSCAGLVSGNPANTFSIVVTGTAATNGVPSPAGTQVCNSYSASWTYLDGVAGSGTTTPACARVIDVTTASSKAAVSSSTLSNVGQYAAADGGARAPAYVYAGDWDGSGSTASYEILAYTSPTQTANAGISYAFTDPMPCLDNGSNNNFTSNAVGTYCQNPGFIPTLVTTTGWTPTSAELLTLVYTDGTTATVPYTANRGWVVPTTRAVAEIRTQPVAAQGSNSPSVTVRLKVAGYAAEGVPAPAVLTNRASVTPYLSSDLTTPISAPTQPAARLQVELPPANGGNIVLPALATTSGPSMCVANTWLVSGNTQTRIEFATAPAGAVYIDYLAPAGTASVAPATSAFLFTPTNTTGAALPSYTSPVVTPNTIQDYNGTGRTLVRWVIPAGVVQSEGLYTVRTASALAVLTYEAGCVGTYTADITIGLGTPISKCYSATGVTSTTIVSNPPLQPFGTAGLRDNGSPVANNHCGWSSSRTVVNDTAAFVVDKTVQGNLDPTAIGGGGTGHVSADGGAATYVVTFKNNGQSVLKNPVMYDLLPRVGDTRASSTAPRNSAYAVALTSVAALPANVTLAYSRALNPCRPEVLASNAGCVNDWSTTAPASLATVTALKFVYTGSIAPAASFAATYAVSTPATAAGGTAWNSIGTSVTAGDTLMSAAESSLTGLQAQSAQPAITKTADRTTVDAVGQIVNYTFTVTNNTAVALTNVRVADALVNSAASSVAPTPVCVARSTPAAACSGGSTTLAAGQSATFTASYTTTQADLDHGSVSDQATATATPPTGPALSNSTGIVTVTATQNGALALAKEAAPTTVDSVGDVIDYTFTVTNTGNVTLRTLSIAETAFSGSGSLSAITCPTGALAPGASAECTATYPVTQADLTAGSVSNTATASAVTPANAPVTSAASTATVDVDQIAALDLVKSATPSGATAYNAGQLITYSFVVTNTGNVPVTGISVDEVSFTGSDPLSAIDCPTDELAPAAQFTCTATYTLTQADVDAASLTNTAVANGTGPAGPVASEESSVRTPQIAASNLTLTKTASTSFVNAAGETVTYTFAVRNLGNVTVHDVAIVETGFEGTGAAPVADCSTTTLAPGQQVLCTADYTVTQADVDNGGFDNTAQATALDTTDADVESSESTATVTATAAPGLSVVKTADAESYAAVGDEVEYSFLVANTGNVTLTGVTATERLFTGSGPISAIDCPADELAPAAQITCTATYVVTQADLDRGSIANTGAATGESPADATVLATPSTVTIAAVQAPVLELEKTATPDEADEAGAEIVYSFHVVNAGNVTLTGLEIAETAFTGTGALIAPDCGLTLAPGAEVDCEVSYVLTQADVDAGEISNTAVATASVGSTPVSSADSVALVTVDRQPALALVKSADAADPVDIAAGDVITYSFVITNTGNVTVTDPAVVEGDFTGTGTLGEVSCENDDPLAPQAQLICVLEYSVTQEDVDAGELSNTATATGLGPLGTDAPVSPASTAALPAPANPALTLTKTTDVTKVGAVGQLVGYTFTITNTGNTTARDVTVSEDAFSGHGSDLVVDCPSIESLLPGQVTVCAATYTVVAADLTGDALVNTASARSTAPDGSVVASAPSTARIADVADTDGPDLAVTGGTIAWGLAVLAVGLLAAGGLLLVMRRRRQHQG